VKAKPGRHRDSLYLDGGTPLKINTLMAAMLVAGGLLAGCGDKAGEPAGDTGAAAVADHGAAGGGKPYLAKDAYDRDILVMDRRDSAGRTYAPFVTFADSYRHGDDMHRAFLDLYFSKVENVDRELLANILSADFRNERDSFKRQDMLAALAPQIDAYLERVRGIGDIAIDTGSTVDIKPYDMEQKGYPMFSYMSFKHLSLEAWEDSRVDVSVYIPAQNLTRDANEDFVLKVDQARARELEAVLAPLRDGNRNATLKVVVKGSATYAGGTTENNGTLGDLSSVVIPDAFDLVHPRTGEVLFTINTQDMLPYYEVADGNFLDGDRFVRGVPSAVRAGYMEKFGIKR